MENTLLQHRHNAEKLEEFFQEDEEGFRQAFKQMHPVLFGDAYQFWAARLSYRHKDNVKGGECSPSSLIHPAILLTFLIIIAGTIAKLPYFFPAIPVDFFFLRYSSFTVLPIIAIYFLLKRRNSLYTTIIVISAIVLSALFVGYLPTHEESQTIRLVLLHIPLFLWLVTGLAFLGNKVNSLSERIEYIRLNGETVIFSLIIAIAGMVLAGFTLGLFTAIDMDMQWYFNWVIVYGVVGVPIVGVHLAATQPRRKALVSSLISKIFAPLFLATLLVYLASVVLQLEKVFLNRDFLLRFNVMLLMVLGISVFSIVERGREKSAKWMDFVIQSLLAIALIIDAIALFAILFRLSSYGLTPNRFTVLGENILIFIHAAGLLFTYTQYVRGRMSINASHNWIARYLPMYGIWTVFVVFILPILWNFR